MACLQIDACTPNILIQETFEEFGTPLAARIVRDPIEIVDGYLEIPDRPGLGIELDEEVMAEHPYDEEGFLDMYGPGGWEKRRLAA